MNKKRSIRMDIDEWLYIKSKSLIPNRTKDYEDHLRRMIAASDRLDLLQKEKMELENKMGYLDKEIDLEIGLQDEMKEIESEVDNLLNQVTNTVINIIHNEGSIGLDRLGEIANYRNVSLSELKANIPKNLRNKIVNYHPKFTNDIRVVY